MDKLFAFPACRLGRVSDGARLGVPAEPFLEKDWRRRGQVPIEKFSRLEIDGALRLLEWHQVAAKIEEHRRLEFASVRHPAGKLRFPQLAQDLSGDQTPPGNHGADSVSSVSDV